MLNETEYLLACTSEEGSEVSQVACKALRFGLDHIWPDKNETNRRILERELADLLAVAEMMGLKIRDEDKAAKKEKLKKYMQLSQALGTLAAPVEVRGICKGCNQPVPPGFYQCDGGGSHPKKGESPAVFCLNHRRVMVDGLCPDCKR